MRLRQRFRHSDSDPGYHGARGDRHHTEFWKRLLPAARQRLVDEGLFTPDGELTDLGRQRLADIEASE